MNWWMAAKASAIGRGTLGTVCPSLLLNEYNLRREKEVGRSQLLPPSKSPFRLSQKEITPLKSALVISEEEGHWRLGSKSPQDEDSHPPEPPVPCCCCFSPTVSDAEFLFQSLSQKHQSRQIDHIPGHQLSFFLLLSDHPKEKLNCLCYLPCPVS